MTTATYLVLLYGDEREWKSYDDAALAALDASHRTFGEQAAAQGHKILSGNQLDYAETALVVRRSRGGAPVVSDGPFAETVEQLGGFYFVKTADRRGLAELVASALTEHADIRLIRFSEEA